LTWTGRFGQLCDRLCPVPLRPYLERLKASALGVRLARGAFWSLVGTAISQGLIMAASIVAARLLSAEQYGELGMIRSTIGMLTTIAGFGLGTSAAKSVAELRDRDRERAGRILGLSRLVALSTGGLLTALLLVFAPWLAERSMGAPHLTQYLRFGAAILLFGAMNGVEVGALVGFEAFDDIARVNLWAGVSSFLLLVVGVLVDGLRGAVIARTLAVIIRWTLGFLATRRAAEQRAVHPTTARVLTEVDMIWSLSLPAALAGVMVGPVTWVGNAMLVRQPNGFYEMGLFSAAVQFRGFLVLVAGTLSGPLLSMVTNQQSRPSDKLARVNILASWVIGVFPALPLLALPEMGEMLFGAGYAGDGFRMTIVAVALFASMQVYHQGITRVLTQHSMLWWGCAVNALWAGMFLMVAYLARSLGAVGLAAAHLTGYIVITLVFVPFCRARGVLPSGTLISAPALLIWVCVALVACCSLLGAPILVRAAVLVGALVAVGWGFRRMMSPEFTRHRAGTG